MTHYPHGAACILDSAHSLCGLITDGDVRRALQAQDDIRGLRAAAVMTANPATIDPDARLQEALRMMEDRPSQISVLPVVDRASGACLGLLRLHDIYRGDIVWRAGQGILKLGPPMNRYSANVRTSRPHCSRPGP